jgi:hypothetical protein
VSCSPRHRERFPLRAGSPLAKHRARVATTLGQAAQSHRAFARRPKALLTPVARDAVDLTAGVFTTTGYADRNELRLANRACHNDQAAFVVLGISNALSHRDRGIRRCRRLALGARQLSVGRVGCFRQSGRSKLRRSGYQRRPRYIRDLRYGGLSASCRRGALAFRRSSL